MTGAGGSRQLTVVGVATSVTGTAQAWVVPAEITALHLSGLLIAAAGALGPASWVARIRTATALRAE